MLQPVEGCASVLHAATEANWQEGRCSQQVLWGHTDYLRCLDWQQAGGRLVSASGSFAEKDCSIRCG